MTRPSTLNASFASNVRELLRSEARLKRHLNLPWAADDVLHHAQACGTVVEPAEFGLLMPHPAGRAAAVELA